LGISDACPEDPGVPLKNCRKSIVLAFVTAALGNFAAPSAASAAASDEASCAGKFATSVPGGPLKGKFASENARQDDPVFGNFGQATSTLFARAEACP
jgi:hypothetical protein